jgi:hypothetical protein
VPGSSAGLSRQREAPGTILPSNAEQRGRSSEIDGSNNRRGVSVVGRQAKTLQLKIVPRLLITSTTLSPPAAGVLLPTYFQPAVRGGLLASGDLTSEKRKIDHEEGNREQRGGRFELTEPISGSARRPSHLRFRLSIAAGAQVDRGLVLRNIKGL